MRSLLISLHIFMPFVFNADTTTVGNTEITTSKVSIVLQ